MSPILIHFRIAKLVLVPLYKIPTAYFLVVVFKALLTVHL
jgi:hypothetical protein